MDVSQFGMPFVVGVYGPGEGFFEIFWNTSGVHRANC